MRSTIRALAVAGAALVALAVPAGACRRARPGPSLEVLVPLLPPSLDPFSDSRLVSRSIFAAIYEPLAQETARGIRPAIADGWTNPAPDTWVFRIAADSTFHDGTPVTSRDVVRAAQSSRLTRGSPASLADLRRIEIVDERTIRFRTHTSAQDFLLAVSALLIPRQSEEGLVGTGPYRVVSRMPDRILLRRHARPGHPDPFLEEVVFRLFSSPAEGLRLLRREGARAVLEPTREMLAEARASPRLRVVTTPPGGLVFLATGFSAEPGPLGDVRVRRALRLAIDLPALVAAGTPPGGTPVGRVIPPGAFGFDPQRTPARRDLPAARALLAAAGFATGLDATLDASETGRETALELAREAAEAGIRLEVVVHAPDAFAGRIDGSSPLYLDRWFVGEDAGQALRDAFHTRDLSRGLGPLNRTGYSNPAVDAALDALAAAATAEERLERLRALSDLLDGDLPWIPLFSPREARILPADLEAPPRPDALFDVSEAHRAGGGR